MTIFTLQYLEDHPRLAHLTPQQVAGRLKDAFERIPISKLLLGWNLPEPLFEACMEVCVESGTQVYRWHPLLASDGVLVPKLEWQTIGVNGDPIPGHAGMLEFTFMCPNRPVVQEAVLNHLKHILQHNRYHGIFLDRMRFPSPTIDPINQLGCFCEDCQQVASNEGLDLKAVQSQIIKMLATQDAATNFVSTLMNADSIASDDFQLLNEFMAFRERSISRFIKQASDLIHNMDHSVGLDCFSPSLAHLVGQDIEILKNYGNWMKIMSYAHALGPAGIPFEILSLANWLIDNCGFDDQAAMSLLSTATQLPLPKKRSDLRQQGLSSQALKLEVQGASKMNVDKLLAGIELVELKGVAELKKQQIITDVSAISDAGVHGLALSWDLWEIPLERLDIVREHFISTGNNSDVL